MFIRLNECSNAAKFVWALVPSLVRTYNTFLTFAIELHEVLYQTVGDCNSEQANQTVTLYIRTCSGTVSTRYIL